MNRSATAATLATLGALCVTVLAAGCDEPCCTFDGQPIALGRGPGGALMLPVSIDDGQPVVTVLDTAAPLTLLRGGVDGRTAVAHRTLRLHDQRTDGQTTSLAIRAKVRAATFTSSLAPLTVGAESAEPQLILGGNLFTAHSVAFDGPSASVTFWPRLAAESSFLSTAGYAVISTPLRGGGESSAQGDPDFLGMRGPAAIPRSRLILRACAAPADFDPDAEPTRCCRHEERTSATGTDLALVLATGVGPTVIGASAWQRILARRPDLGAAQPGGVLSVPWAAGPAIAASTAALPRLAIVDQEADDNTDPGPCVELGRARRLEQVARRQVRQPELGTCAEPCDQTSARDTHARSSAAYVDIGGPLPVIVVADDSPLLQSLRAALRGDGPEVDGLLGASFLEHLRVEIDYLATPARLVTSCAPAPCAAGPDDPSRGVCWAVSRCPRLPDAASRHACFCLPPHGLPDSCQASTCP